MKQCYGMDRFNQSRIKLDILAETTDNRYVLTEAGKIDRRFDGTEYLMLGDGIFFLRDKSEVEMTKEVGK